MTDVESLDQLKTIISERPFVLAYISRPSCGVCTALKPKVIDIVDSLDPAEAWYVNLDTIPEAAGEYSVFTMPGILLFVDGKETIREARYVSVPELEEKMRRIHELRFEER